MWQWILTHRTQLGAILTAIFAALQADPSILGTNPTVLWIFGMISIFILGSGSTKSDKYYRDRQ